MRSLLVWGFFGVRICFGQVLLPLFDISPPTPLSPSAPHNPSTNTFILQGGISSRLETANFQPKPLIGLAWGLPNNPHQYKFQSDFSFFQLGWSWHGLAAGPDLNLPVHLSILTSTSGGFAPSIGFQFDPWQITALIFSATSNANKIQLPVEFTLGQHTLPRSSWNSRFVTQSERSYFYFFEIKSAIAYKLNQDLRVSLHGNYLPWVKFATLAKKTSVGFTINSFF
jgi:hypothetical protein